MRLVQALNSEWQQLAQQPANALAVQRWAVQAPALRGLRSLTDLCDSFAALRRTGDPGCTDEPLLALLELAHDGEELAGRAVVQLFLGRAARLIQNQVRTSGAETCEVEAQVIAALWQAVMRYPRHRRPRRVAANLAMDSLRLTQHHWLHSPTPGAREEGFGTTYEVPLLATEDQDPALNATERREPAAWPRVVHLLSDAVAHGAITGEQAQVLLQVYAPPPGQQAHGVAEVAAQLGITTPTLHRRLSRLTARLVQYVKDVEQEGRRLRHSPAGAPRLGATVDELMRAA
ncbi:hypothetical protein [Kineococcus gypseus]|uniref:hypothetical protein n=1 Tax=Kineococcus gypseus TaxID=1637102 RepID=UPI003D7CAA6C